MGELFENIGGLLPIAVIIAVQILRLRSKAANSRKKKGEEETMEEVFQKRPPENSLRGHWELDDNGAPGRSAPPRSTGRRPGTVRKPMAGNPFGSGRALLTKAGKEAAAESAYKPKPDAVKQALAAESAPPPRKTEAPAAQAAPPAGKNTAPLAAPVPDSFPGRFTALPPLKRAVVFAEILGAPKGLQ